MRRFLLFAFLVCSLSLAPPAKSQPPEPVTVILTWEAPTTNEDGSPYTDAAGFKVYWGKTIDTLTNIEDVPGAAAVTHTFQVPFDDLVFVVAAVDTSGNISVPSQGASLHVHRPGSPGNVACSGTYALVVGHQVTVNCVPIAP